MSNRVQHAEDNRNIFTTKKTWSQTRSCYLCSHIQLCIGTTRKVSLCMCCTVLQGVRELCLPLHTSWETETSLLSEAALLYTQHTTGSWPLEMLFHYWKYFVWFRQGCSLDGVCRGRDIWLQILLYGFQLILNWLCPWDLEGLSLLNVQSGTIYAG